MVTKPIKPTLKRYVVRWLDNISRQIRARLEVKSETHITGNPSLPGSPIDDAINPPHLHIVCCETKVDPHPPCLDWVEGANGLCRYCNQDKGCHIFLGTR